MEDGEDGGGELAAIDGGGFEDVLVSDEFFLCRRRRSTHEMSSASNSVRCKHLASTGVRIGGGGVDIAPIILTLGWETSMTSSVPSLSHRTL